MWIELTWPQNNEKVLINISNYDSIGTDSNGCTYIAKTGVEEYQRVKESKEEILKLIEAKEKIRYGHT